MIHILSNSVEVSILATPTNYNKSIERTEFPPKSCILDGAGHRNLDKQFHEKYSI